MGLGVGLGIQKHITQVLSVEAATTTATVDVICCDEDYQETLD